MTGAAATRIAATWCRRALSGACRPPTGPAPARTAMETGCRCYHAAPCCSGGYCSNRRRSGACRAPGGWASFWAASGRRRRCGAQERETNRKEGIKYEKHTITLVVMLVRK